MVSLDNELNSIRQNTGSGLIWQIWYSIATDSWVWTTDIHCTSDVYCTLYIRCILYIVHCTVYIWCILYIVLELVGTRPFRAVWRNSDCTPLDIQLFLAHSCIFVKKSFLTYPLIYTDPWREAAFAIASSVSLPVFYQFYLYDNNND